MTHIPTILFLSHGKKQAGHNKTIIKTQPKILFAALPNVMYVEESRGLDSECQHPSTYVWSSLQLHVSSTNKSVQICEIVRASSGLPRWLSDKNPPATQVTWVQCLSWEDPLEQCMGTHSSILAWEIQEPGRLQSMGSQRVRHNLVTKQHLAV